MKRSRFGPRLKSGRDAEQLSRLAAGYADSGSRVEDAYWENRLSALVDRVLRTGEDATLEAALEHLYESNPHAYDGLIDLIEARSEGGVLTLDDGHFDVLMFAVPVLAWSRFTIPSGTIPQAALAGIRAQLHGHVLAADARLALADFLFSPDQLPRGYGPTFVLGNGLWGAAVEGRDLSIDPGRLPEAKRFLSDVRYLVAAVAAHRGSALFRWQEEPGSREQMLAQWKAQGTECIRPLFPGCAFDLLPPAAYFSAWRAADQLARPYSLRSSVAFLQTALNVEARELSAVIAPFHDQRIEEFRVGFTLRDQTDVLYGSVWPLLDSEDETTDTAGQIETVLRECGVDRVAVIENRFPMEYCEECGAPFFPSPEGESVHAELPEETESAPAHLH